MLAYDAGPGVGFGHKRRMESLATALEDRGCRCELQELAGDVEADVIVVDSYRVRADDRARVRGRVVVAVDDLERDLAVDVVVDPSPGALAEVHRAAGIVLAGADYALIDGSLRQLDRKPVADDVQGVLVTMGGTGRELALDIAAAMKAALANVAVSVAAARQPPDHRLDHLIPIERTGGLGGDLAAADLVVTAGGVTLLEAMCLGRPIVAVVIAANQERAVAGAARLGAVLDATAASAAEAAVALVVDPQRRRELGERAADVIDGQGAARVASASIRLARFGPAPGNDGPDV